eukprot:TRINITY_DN6407_c0_g1_i1.p1 TRINITY_DN6407_c0_g1~~TRINITY_DN6407_c0_g1_i1.p1  ORF type:complete len:1714 (+),score=224.17 TRINITY_DN6407_c0_g1_i1:330-5144(+)
MEGLLFVGFRTLAVVVEKTAAVTLRNCTFTQNILLGSNNGILMIQGSAMIDSCTFFRNSLRSGEGVEQVAGGAVSIRPGCAQIDVSVVFHKCIFQENVVTSFSKTPDSSGGAISYLEPACPKGAIGRRSFTISNSRFDQNVVTCAAEEKGRHTRNFLSTGGAVDVNSMPPINVSIRDTSFSGSEILSDPSVLQGLSVEGGAVNLALADSQSFISIERCQFNSNSAIAGQYPISSDSTIGGYCYGGAISISASSVATIDSCSFSLNSCTGGTGSALSGRAYGGAVSYRTYERTTAFAAPGRDRNVGLSIVNSTFDQNFANSVAMLANQAGGAAAGGALFIWFSFDSRETTVIISSSSFARNSVVGTISADANGGALALFWDIRPQKLNTTIEYCVFQENRVTGSDSSPIPSDYAARGGAISIVTRISVEQHIPTFLNVSFFNNSAQAALCASEIQNCYLGGNAYGGAVSAFLSEVDLPARTSFPFFVNCVFEGNFASLGSLQQDRKKTASGGALWWKLSTQRVVLYQSVFRENYAIISPLATRNDDSSSNTGQALDATCSGGAAALKDGASIEECIFESNGAGLLNSGENNRSGPLLIVVQGGAIDASSELTVLRSTFVNNKAVGAVTSGHIAYAEGANIDISNSSFIGNQGVNSAVGVGGLFWGFGLPKIANSTFLNNSLVSPSGVLSGFGADIAGKFVSLGSITGCTFVGSRAGFGGSLAISFDNGMPNLAGNVFRNCSASGGGAVFVTDLGAVPISAINSSFLNPQAMRFESNYAMYGPNFSSSKVSLAFAQPPPRVAWPSQPFKMRVGAYDIFQQLTIHPEITLRLNVTTDAPGWHFPAFVLSGLTSEGILLGSHNLYEFEAVELTTPPGTHSRVQINAGEFPEDPLAFPEPILVAACPPGYTSFQAIDAYGCRRCAANEFNLDGNSTCDECPESEVPGLHACFSSPNLQANDQESSQTNHLDAGDGVLTWVIHRGFFPVPSFTSPQQLLPCLNAEACLQYNCTLSYNGTVPILECGHCDENDDEHHSHLAGQKSCLCEEGYADRLCSKCICNEHECYFSSDNEEQECHKCQSNSSWLLVIAIIFLQLSMIAFLVFRRSAATLFLTEFVLVVILMILGIGETWLFQVVCVMALMFLLSAAENRRKNRADAHSRSGKGSHKHAHHEEHLAAAKMTGIVKVILFFLQSVPAVVPSEAWPAWVGAIVRLLSALSLRVSGLECISPTLFASPVGRFSFVMSLPVLFSVSIGVSVIFAALINWAGIVPKMKVACSRLLCEKKRQPPLFANEDDGSDSDDRDDAPHAVQAPDADSLSQSAQSSDSEIDVVTVDPHSEEESLLLHDQHGGSSHFEQVDRRPVTFSQRVLPRIQFSILFILFAGHFELSNTVLAILRPCDHGYMKSYPYIQCSWTEDRRYFILTVLSLIFLFAYFLGIPALFGFFLLRHRKHIREGAEHADDRIGFLYETFRREVYWFEMVWIARRLLISLIITFIPMSSGIQAAAMSIVLLTFLVVQRAVMPFSSKLVNYLELLASFVLLYSYIVGTEISSHFEAFNERATVKMFFQSALWILNALVVVILVVSLVQPSLARTFRSIKSRCFPPRKQD